MEGGCGDGVSPAVGMRAGGWGDGGGGEGVWGEGGEVGEGE